MAVSEYIKNKNAVYLALGFNVNQATPLDARLVVTEYTGLTQASTGDNVFYDGIVVSVVEDPDSNKNGLYQLIHMPANNINNWHKIATEAEVENVKNTLSSINGGSIQLSNTYDGEENGESPAKGDTINSAIKKIVDIIIKDEKVTASSANDLNDKIGKLSGDAITNVSLNDDKTKLVITKDGNNIEIKLTDLANIYTFDTTGDVKFTTTTGSDGKVTIKGNIESFDCGEYEGQN